MAGSLGFAATDMLLGWNDLGMRCTDTDYSVFSILPAYNTIHVQFVSQDQLMTAGADVTVTYKAMADPAGSVNRTSIGETVFWQYAGRHDAGPRHGSGGLYHARYAVCSADNAL